MSPLNRQSSRATLGSLTAFALGMLLLLLCPSRAQAFALLGPFAPWMTYTNGMRLPQDIGGPMDLGHEYRWNVPVVTYGFDQSFRDFFGSNGIAAVEAAIAILNALPRASNIVLSNYAFETSRINPQASLLGVFDLKSAALAALLEQLGLNNPVRHVFDLGYEDEFARSINAADWWLQEFPFLLGKQILMHNYDPESLQPSQFVNDALFSAGFARSDAFPYGDLVEWLIDPLTYVTAVARNPQDLQGPKGGGYIGLFEAGVLIRALTRDDVGALRYLFHSTNVNFETLLPGVQAAGPNSSVLVNAAYRPGVEKITFMPHPMDQAKANFLSWTNQFVDHYFTNGNLGEQTLERVTREPDFLFSAADWETNQTAELSFKRTDTSKWINLSHANYGSNAPGPGIITPAVKITFGKGADFAVSDDFQPGDHYSYFFTWGYFSTSNYLVFPRVASTGTNEFQVRLRLGGIDVPLSSVLAAWQFQIPVGGAFQLETSTNLTDWLPKGTVINRFGSVEWRHWPSASRQFFRVVPQ